MLYNSFPFLRAIFLYWPKNNFVSVLILWVIDILNRAYRNNLNQIKNCFSQSWFRRHTPSGRYLGFNFSLYWNNKNLEISSGFGMWCVSRNHKIISFSIRIAQVTHPYPYSFGSPFSFFINRPFVSIRAGQREKAHLHFISFHWLWKIYTQSMRYLLSYNPNFTISMSCKFEWSQ